MYPALGIFPNCGLAGCLCGYSPWRNAWNRNCGSFFSLRRDYRVVRAVNIVLAEGTGVRFSRAVCILVTVTGTLSERSSVFPWQLACWSRRLWTQCCCNLTFYVEKSLLSHRGTFKLKLRNQGRSHGSNTLQGPTNSWFPTFLYLCNTTQLQVWLCLNPLKSSASLSILG